MTSTYDEAVERRARAIESDAWAMKDRGMSEAHWQREVNRSLNRARDTLEADDAAGYALVPKEATGAMLDAMSSAYDKLEMFKVAIAAGAVMEGRAMRIQDILVGNCPVCGRSGGTCVCGNIKRIAELEAERDQLMAKCAETRDALDLINIWSSPGNRTFDQMIDAMGLVNNLAREALDSDGSAVMAELAQAKERWHKLARKTKAWIGELMKVERERLRARCAEMRDALEYISEEHDAGRHDGLPEPCPAHDADTMFAVARAALDSDGSGYAAVVEAAGKYLGAEEHYAEVLETQSRGFPGEIEARKYLNFMRKELRAALDALDK